MIALSDEIKAAFSLVEELENDGHELRREGNRLVLRCPFHEEKTPSCKVSPDTGRYYCFGCGAAGTVIDYLAHKMKVTPGDAIKELAGQLPHRGETRPIGLITKAPVQRTAWQPYRMNEGELKRCVAMAEKLLKTPQTIKKIASARQWDADTIRNLALDPCMGLFEGKLVYIYPTGAKKRLKPLTPNLAESFAGTPFVWLFGAQNSLWRGDRILPCTERVHITEGETAAIALIDAGIDNETTEIVVAVPGAQAWRNEYAPAFRGKRVTLWPDADKSGEEMARRIIHSLAGIAKSIDMVNLNTTEAA